MAQWQRQWDSPAWFEQVDTWVNHVLEAYDVDRVGPLIPRSRGLSSAVFSLATQAGIAYMKAPAPARRGEADLLARIAPHLGGHVVQPLAVEPDEGWILSPATGHDGEPVAALTPRIMSDAAATQLALADLADVVAEAGLRPAPEGSPDPGRLAQEAVERHASLPASHPLALPAAEATQLLRGLPKVDGAGEALAASGVPSTVVPQPLTLSDILVPGSRRAPVAFLGWGAVRWAHPFVWVAPLVARAAEESTEEDLGAALGAYLEAFSGHGNVDDLAAALGPAQVLADLLRHRDLLSLLLEADTEDQSSRAAEVFGLLYGVLGTSRGGGSHSGRSHRH